LLVESFGGCSVMFSAEAASSSMLFADASDVRFWAGDAVTATMYAQYYYVVCTLR
jgi:hypothetical protein